MLAFVWWWWGGGGVVACMCLRVGVLKYKRVGAKACGCDGALILLLVMQGPAGVEPALVFRPGCLHMREERK